MARSDSDIIENAEPIRGRALHDAGRLTSANEKSRPSSTESTAVIAPPAARSATSYESLHNTVSGSSLSSSSEYLLTFLIYSLEWIYWISSRVADLALLNPVLPADQFPEDDWLSKADVLSSQDEIRFHASVIRMVNNACQGLIVGQCLKNKSKNG